jgi:hypothetical protein
VNEEIEQPANVEQSYSYRHDTCQVVSAYIVVFGFLVHLDLSIPACITLRFRDRDRFPAGRRFLPPASACRKADCKGKDKKNSSHVRLLHVIRSLLRPMHTIKVAKESVT